MSTTTTPGITPGTHKWFVLSVVSVGTFMATLDGSIVNISLPTIQSAFGVSLSAIEWVVVAYLHEPERSADWLPVRLRESATHSQGRTRTAILPARVAKMNPEPSLLAVSIPVVVAATREVD